MIDQPSSPNVPASAERQPVLVFCLVLAAITFAVFGQTLHHQFINYDDNQYVYENPVVAQGLTFHGIVWAFTHAYSDNWHPLTWLSHMLDCQLYGLRPGGHHLTNVLLHAATVMALFLVLRQMTGALWRSAFVAAVFAIHPLRVESVAWVAERKDVLSGLFFMLTIGAYVRYVRRPQPARGYGLVVLLFALGLMCKPMLVTLPLVLLLLDYWPLQRMESQKLSGLVMEKLPLFALSVVSCVVTLLAQNKAIQSTESYSLPIRFANALVAGKVYLEQMVYPLRLAVFYPLPPVLSVRKVALAGVVLAGLSVVAWMARRKQPWLLMGWLWYLVMLLPVAGIVQVGAQAHADRYTYLPQIGIYMAVTWLVAERWMNRVALGSLMTGLLVVFMACAWKQTAYWKNSETLWAHTIACTTDNYLVHNNYGTALMEMGKMDEASIQFRQALQLKPEFAEARNNLGNALLLKGGVDEAIAYCQEVLKTKPHFAEAHLNLGNAFDRKGRMDEAIVQFQQALESNPAYAQAHNNLGVDLCKKGRVDEGITQFQQALESNPGYAEAHNNLGNALMQQGRVDEAIACYQKALAVNPGYVPARNNLERALRQKQ